MVTTTISNPASNSSVTANGTTSTAMGTGAARKDVIGSNTNDIQVGANNNSGVNTKIDTIANDVKTIARFLVVSEADRGMRFEVVEAILGEVIKALEESKSEITALKAKILKLEAQNNN